MTQQFVSATRGSGAIDTALRHELAKQSDSEQVVVKAS